jgi:hypothetical protein
VHSPKNLLGLHCMHNSFFEPCPILMSKRMSKFFCFESKFWTKIQICFIKFPYSLIWAFKSISKSSKPLVQIYLIQILDQFPYFYLWESSKTFIQIQNLICNPTFQQPKNKKLNSYSFSHFAESTVQPTQIPFYFHSKAGGPTSLVTQHRPSQSSSSLS